MVAHALPFQYWGGGGLLGAEESMRLRIVMWKKTNTSEFSVSG